MHRGAARMEQAILPSAAFRTWRPEDNPFSVVVVDLTHRCNMECANCYLPNRDVADMDTARLKTALSALPTRTSIRLIGGEPTLRDDLPEILRFITAAGHIPVLLTNGLKMARSEYCAELRAAGLRYVYISMNGADEDEVYKVLDCGKYATVKRRALVNAFRSRFLVSTGTIVARGTNEHTVRRQIELVERCALESGRRKNWPAKLAPVLRFKTIGEIGRYMSGRSLDFRDLVRIVGDATSLSEDAIYGHRVRGASIETAAEMDDDEVYAALVPIETRAGRLLLRLVDWSVDRSGIPLANSEHRGRLTENFEIAPFFEHVKRNEFGY